LSYCTALQTAACTAGIQHVSTDS